MAGARGLWRATGMKDGDFGKPIIAVVNSFTQFVPGHVHLKDLGQLVAREIEAAGGVAKEFNTIAVDDGIAMGHDGMLYSLPSREIIADSVEYMVNAHCADAMVCISNCDKITPGMLMASMRLNIPVVFVSGGPMEAGKVVLGGKQKALDLVDAMVAAADDKIADADVAVIERSACPTCGSCSGMFTANSMNCLTEALGLALPGNGTVLATHADRKRLFVEAGHLIVDLAKRHYEQDDYSVLPRAIARFEAFENAMTLDIAMGGSTIRSFTFWPPPMRQRSTSRCRTSIACRGGCRCSARLRHRLPTCMSKMCIAPAASWRSSGNWIAPVSSMPIFRRFIQPASARRWNAGTSAAPRARPSPISFGPRPAGVPTQVAFSQSARWDEVDIDRSAGVIRDAEHAFSKDGGLAVLYGNLAEDGSIVKTAGVDAAILKFSGPARIFESQDAAVEGILGNKVKAGDIVLIRYEGPRGAPACRRCSIPQAI